MGAVGGPAQRVTALESACQQFPSIWAVVPAVISEAERASRVELPEFWKAHAAAGTSSRVLPVWGIWIEPVSEIATYEVSTNQDFDPPIAWSTDFACAGRQLCQP